MKRLTILLFAAAALLAGCAKVGETDITPVQPKDNVITVKAVLSTTKVVGDADAQFAWQAGDAIGIWNGSSFTKFTIDAASLGDDEATFSATVTADELELGADAFAVYPYSEASTYDAASHTYTPGDLWNVQLFAPANVSGDEVTYYFKHLATTVKLQLADVPEEAVSLFFETWPESKYFITGATVDLSADTPVLAPTGTNDWRNLPLPERTGDIDKVVYLPVAPGEYVNNGHPGIMMKVYVKGAENANLKVFTGYFAEESIIFNRADFYHLPVMYCGVDPKSILGFSPADAYTIEGNTLTTTNDQWNYACTPIKFTYPTDLDIEGGVAEKYLGGVVKATLKNVPKEAKYVFFEVSGSSKIFFTTATADLSVSPALKGDGVDWIFTPIDLDADGDVTLELPILTGPYADTFIKAELYYAADWGAKIGLDKLEATLTTGGSIKPGKVFEPVFTWQGPVEAPITVDGSFVDWLYTTKEWITPADAEFQGIRNMKLAVDDDNLYIYLEINEKAADLSYPTPVDIFIDCDGDYSTGGKLTSTDNVNTTLPFVDSGLNWYIELGDIHSGGAYTDFTYGAYKFVGADGASIWSLSNMTGSYGADEMFGTGGVTSDGVGRVEIRLDRKWFGLVNDKARVGVKIMDGNDNWACYGLTPIGPMSGTESERVDMALIEMTPIEIEPEPVGKIQIDGKFDDWAGCETVWTLPENAIFPNIKAMKLDADEDYAYVYLELVETNNVEDRTPFDLFINSDGNNATGCIITSLDQKAEDPYVYIPPFQNPGIEWYIEGTLNASETTYADFTAITYYLKYNGADGDNFWSGYDNLTSSLAGHPEKIYAQGVIEGEEGKLEIRLSREAFGMTGSKAAFGVKVMDGLVNWRTNGLAPQVAPEAAPTYTVTPELLYVDLPGGSTPEPVIDIEIDGDMSDWANVEGTVQEASGEEGVEGAQPITNLKGWADEDNIYVYVKRVKLGRWTQIWGGESSNAGYYYYDFDLDNDPTTGSYAEGSSHGNFEAYTYLYIFGGTSDAPVFRPTPPGSAKGMTITNVKVAGVVTDDAIEVEASFPKADLPAITGDTITVGVWGNKDGNPFTKVTFKI